MLADVPTLNADKFRERLTRARVRRIRLKNIGKRRLERGSSVLILILASKGQAEKFLEGG